MKKRSIFYSIVILLLLVGWYTSHQIDQTIPQSHSGAVALSTTKAGPDRLYPDPLLTPGDVLPATKEDVCTPGYSASVRDVPLRVKKQVYTEYGATYPAHEGTYEVDHFISLELGGSNDIKNLFLEPADPRPGFHEKDVVENYIHREVCNGDITLEEAQKEIASDWYAVYLKATQY